MTRVRRTSALVLALGMAGALAACSQESDESTESAPSTTTPTSTATPATTAGAAATTPAAPDETDSAPVLGPDGIGALELGMGRDEAVASGVVEPFVEESGSSCPWRSQLSDAPGDATPAAPELASGIVHVSSTLGVAVIDAYPGLRTPEGIGIGSPVSAVDTAYPTWAPSEILQRGYAPVPGNDQARYRIAFDDAGAVTELTLQFVDQDCYE
jgi:hypothetical protein